MIDLLNWIVAHPWASVAILLGAIALAQEGIAPIVQAWRRG